MTGEEFEKSSEKLKAAILALDRRSPNERIPGQLRERACELAGRGRAQGLSWAQVAQAVGLRVNTLYKWMEGVEGGRGRRRLVAVRIKHAAPPPGGVGLRLVTSGGARLEGLDLEQAITVLRALG